MDLVYLKSIISRLGKESIEGLVVKREYDITNLGFNNRNRVILARLEDNEELYLYTNLLTSRRDVVGVLGEENLEKTYEKINRAQLQKGTLSLVDFRDFFEEIDLDLHRLPFIKYYREDGGYYLTSSIYISCYENICNASYHRTMYISRDRAVLRIVPRHLYYIISRYFDRGLDAPVALVLGLDPVHELAAAMTPPLGVFEVEVGGVLGGEYRVVKTPIYNIPVPANASIIVEGTISMRERALEGPFTDILMLLDQRREQPVFRAEHIYVSRSRPHVVHAIIPGLWEHQLLMGFPREALMYIETKRVAPCVEAVRLTEGGSMWLHGVISISRKCSEGDARLAAIAATSAHPSIKHIVVVDDDIDIDDPRSIEWAIATRTKGGEDLIVIRDIRGSSLEPRSRDGVGDKVIVLAITPRNESFDKYKKIGVP